MIIDRPQPGFFRVREKKAGPWVPAAIYAICHCTINGGDDNWSHEWRGSCDRYRYPDAELFATIDGKVVDVLRVWERGHRIGRSKYKNMVAYRDWCRVHDRERLNAATPAEHYRVDLLPPIF